ncbi:MAG: carboxylate--amine ligase [Gordonia sp. (in: high G+C Gram-positive bacteria)]
MASSGKHVLITFGRSFLTLNLARLMHAAGHRVTVVDSIPVGVSRFSHAVDAFHRVPPPKFAPQDYCRALATIVVNEAVDIVIPIHEETDILAMMTGLFPPECMLFLSDFDTENRLHNKFDYSQELAELGIPTLKFARVARPEDVATLDFDGPFALKRCYSRGSQKVYKVHPGDDLSWIEYDPTNPWLAQEWLTGDRYCTYSVCRDGKVLAHATYPVSYAIGGSSCLSFTSVDHRPIFDWVTKFVAAEKFTGQIGLDFIDHPERGLFTIECNPRATSGIMMFGPHNRIDRAFLGELGAGEPVVVPDADVNRMIGFGMLLYGWREDSRQGRTLRQFIRDFRAADDVVFERGDEKPGLLMPVAYLGILRSCLRYRVGLAEGFMHDHEWDGHPI